MRKFKVVGVLMAIVAIFAAMASAAQATFTSAGSTVVGSSTKDFLDTFGSATCTNSTFHGSIPFPSETLRITPEYSSCTAYGLPATLDFTSCAYLFHKKPGVAGTVDISCNAGDAVDLNVYASTPHGTPICHVRIPAQTGKSGFSFTNSSGGAVLQGAIGAMTASQTRTSIFCAAGTHVSTAAYTIQTGGITLAGLTVD